MARFNGRGLLQSFSCEKMLSEPLLVSKLGILLELPEGYISNLIVVRGTHKLDENDLIFNDEEIILFLATMGG